MLATTSDPAVAPVRAGIDPRLVISLFSVYVIWSSTYLAMRIAVQELPALLMVAIRFILAGAILMYIARRRGAAWPSARDWLRVAPIGVLLFLCGNGFVSIAQLSIPSGGAAVVCAMMPLWMGVLGAISGDRPTVREWTSLAIGFAGILVLMGGPSLAGEPLHIVLLVLSPVAWGLGSLLARRLTGPYAKDAFMLPAMQMITGAVALAVAGLLDGERLPSDASAKAWGCLVYLFVFGSLIGFTSYNWLLRNTRPAVATSYAYVNPVLAVLLGAVLSGEPVGPTTVVASALMVGAIWLALRRPTVATAHGSPRENAT